MTPSRFANQELVNIIFVAYGEKAFAKLGVDWNALGITTDTDYLELIELIESLIVRAGYEPAQFYASLDEGEVDVQINRE